MSFDLLRVTARRGFGIGRWVPGFTAVALASAVACGGKSEGVVGQPSGSSSGGSGSGGGSSGVGSSGVGYGSSGVGSSGVGFGSSGVGFGSSGVGFGSSGVGFGSSGVGFGSSGVGSSGVGQVWGSSGGALPPGCPIPPPSTGESCASEGLGCQYGTDPDVACDIVATCSGGIWHTTPAANGPLCPSSQPGENGCPTSFPGGQPCSAEGAGCTYLAGVCACLSPYVVAPGDGGLEWECATTGPGCPSPRSQPGTYCGNAGEVCTYGDCATPGGPVTMTCTAGSGGWALSVGTCE